MIRPVLIGLPLILGLFFLTGCASWGGQFPGSSAVDHKPTMAALAERAAVFEATDEIQLALLCWRTILNFDPDDPEALANLERLERSATQRARDAYLEGEKALGASRPKDARQAFLKTLRLDPSAQEARQKLQQLMNPPNFQRQRLQPGETLSDLSRRFYGRPQGAGLIAFVNDIPVNAEVLAPRSLKIPLLSTRQPYQIQQTKQLLSRARALSREGRHEKVLSITSRLLRENPNIRQAVALQNKSRFILGQRLYRQQRYLEAVPMLEKIQSPYPGLEALRADLKTEMAQQAEAYYRDGIKYFLNDELKRAVESWRLTLGLDPDHQEAAAGIRKAENLLQKLETVDEE